MENIVNNSFSYRHIGPRDVDIKKMLQEISISSLEDLSSKVLPKSIQNLNYFDKEIPLSEEKMLEKAVKIASHNKVYRSYLGMGYHGSIVPPVIQRNILENPGWYTSYTPYQAEISQGRLEALLNFQTMISDLTGLPVANSSLLDEATAAAEAMSLSFAANKRKENKLYFISDLCHAQTIAVVKGRAECLGLEVIVGDIERLLTTKNGVFGALIQYPASNGAIKDYKPLIKACRENNVLVTLACDLLALVLLKSPGELGSDIAIGSSQRFGVPMGYGGPHAAFFAVRDNLKRLIPGRIVGVSKDVCGKTSYRLALQTREQHIRREKATSNICTAQALLAIMAGAYSVYHGAKGLKQIALDVNKKARIFALGLKRLGFSVGQKDFFDTVQVFMEHKQAENLIREALVKEINIRAFDKDSVTISFDETVDFSDVKDLLDVFSLVSTEPEADYTSVFLDTHSSIHDDFLRKDVILSNEVFNKYHSETEMMRYLKRLENKDISLVNSMIPLGSCTMKLNAASELMPVSYPSFNKLHPFVPEGQAKGYKLMISELEELLKKLTGFSAISFQPNSGSQGEFAGLKVIRAFHFSRGEGKRNVCLIPKSAHGTNPASASMAGLKVVAISCDAKGNIDLDDLRSKAQEFSDQLAAIMVTYPSTHGVFEENIIEICKITHENGGQVYLDGANMNAQLGLCRPSDYGADVCHLNLHKTFCIPHGGGGPGVGPIGVKEHLKSFLPGHVLNQSISGDDSISSVAAAPYGSASILPISWSYIQMMGTDGLKKATQVAILNANYIAYRLCGYYDVLYKGASGLVAHECIVDVRPFKKTSDVSVFDIAKRLMDYGFHAPTVSFPVAGTLMIEPTESESKEELDRFCDAMISIREEIKKIETSEFDRKNNPLKNSPHTVEVLTSSKWDRPYSRELAAYPLDYLKETKFWPPVSRIDEAYGDRNFACTCS